MISGAVLLVQNENADIPWYSSIPPPFRFGKPSFSASRSKGVSFMEDDNNWHYRIPTIEEVRKAKKELGIEK